MEPPVRTARRGWWCGLLIALVFALWGLHTAPYNNIVDTDAARHAMNGAFLHDLLTHLHPADLFHFSKILDFARSYYGHLPATSLPYHPPLFPAFEAIFFFVFGVNVLAARLAIAVAVALSAWFLFELVRSTHRSLLVAAFSTVTFLALPQALRLGSDVMLEFPAMVFVILAMRCLAGADAEYSWKRAVVFALLAGAAVWTKQQTVFLGAVPFLYFALIGRWRLLRKAPIWISSGLFLAQVAALSLLSMQFHGAGVNQAAPYRQPLYLFVARRVTYYLQNYAGALGPAGVALLAAFGIALLLRLEPRRPTALYVSWAACGMFLLIVLRPYSSRYLFFVAPPVFVLGYASLAGMMDRSAAARRWAQAAACAILAAALAFGAPRRTVFLSGPDEAARTLAALRPHRVLYCGVHDGNFIFSYRSLRPAFETVILSADKLPSSAFAALGDFARRYGVEYIVIEHNAFERQTHRWDSFMDAPPANVAPFQDVPLADSENRWNGRLRIYRVTDPSPTPDNCLTMHISAIDGYMPFTIAPESAGHTR